MKHLKLYIFFILLINKIAFSQTFIKGVVRDATTKEGIGFANLYIKGTTIGTSTDDTGYFEFRLDKFYDTLSVSYLGYAEKSMPINKTNRQTINFELGSSENELFEAVIYANRESFEDYLIRMIIENKPKNDKANLENYSYDAYNKIELDIKHISEKLSKRKILKPFAFVLNNIDSTSEAEPFLPILLSESLSKFYFSNNPDKKREVVEASKISGIQDASATEFMSSLYEDINIYKNTITLLDKAFISPIANNCKLFYKYKIVDTIIQDNALHYRLIFEPKAKGDNTFFGSFVVAENNFAIKNMQLKMSPYVNINFVKRIEINQEFEFINNKFWMNTQNNLLIDFVALEKKPGILARRNSIYKNYELNTKANEEFIQKTKTEIIIPKDEDELKKDNAFWDTSRFETLTKNQAAIYHLVDTVKSLKAYKTFFEVFNFVFTGYKEFGPIGIGPISNAVSFNKLEGWRFGLGFKTNEKLSDIIALKGNIAYGLRDKRIKGSLSTKILIAKNPRQVLKVSYVHDVSKMSSSTDLLSNDNLFNFVILRKKAPIRLLLMDEAKLGYELEWKRGYSSGITLQNRRILPELVSYNYLQENNTHTFDTIRKLNQTEMVLNTRIAFGEKYFNSNSIFRSSLNSYKIPVLQMEYVLGLKNVFKSMYNYHKLSITFTQIQPIKPIGRLETKIQAGRIYGNVPYLLMYIPDGNQTYFYSNTAFNLMNDYEFFANRYLMWNLTHHFDGYFLNKIPGIRKLKIRETLHFRGVWGNTTNTNKINNSSSQTTALLKKPYMELGFGLENIVKFIRVDAIWRLSYRDNPTAPNFGIRVGFNFTF